KKNRSIKRIIKKKIRVINNKNQFISDSKKDNNETKKVVLVQNPILPTKSLSTPTIVIKKDTDNRLTKQQRFEARSGKDNLKKPTTLSSIVEIGVDDKIYDVVICIPSHNRFEKVLRIIDSLYEQKTNHLF